MLKLPTPEYTMSASKTDEPRNRLIAAAAVPNSIPIIKYLTTTITITPFLCRVSATLD